MTGQGQRGHDWPERIAGGERDERALPVPGKVTRTSKLPGKGGHVQRRPLGGTAPLARGAAGDPNGNATAASPVEDWIP